jgi:hypothetical protein
VDDELSQSVDLIEKHCLQLAEHFDSVRIIATGRTQDGKTSLVTWGQGNYYAQKASIEEWLVEQDQNTRNGCYVSDDDED